MTVAEHHSKPRLPLSQVVEGASRDAGIQSDEDGDNELNLRYIGSKARIADAIADVVGVAQGKGVFVDGFCGTGAVAAAVARRGWKVRINDSLRSAVITASARLLSRGDVPFRKFHGYASAVARLNEVDGAGGFFWREYSPASAIHGKPERRYFTEKNAARIDAVRSTIKNWRAGGDITEREESLLLADLMLAVNRVANIAGTYGCFLSKWSGQALRPFEMKARRLRSDGVQFEYRIGDVGCVPAKADDVVYLDPPYTKRQYAAYYHILETLAVGDEPVVGGITGLRPWKTLASPYCYKTKALGALVDLVGSFRARRILLSYSNEGHVARESLVSSLTKIGRVEVLQLGSVGRYRPNRVAVENASSVAEYLIIIESRTKETR